MAVFEIRDWPVKGRLCGKPLTLAMTAMLSCPDSPLLSHIVGKLPFTQPVNQRQLARASNSSLYGWNVVGSGPAAFGQEIAKAAVSNPPTTTSVQTVEGATGSVAGIRTKPCCFNPRPREGATR